MTLQEILILLNYPFNYNQVTPLDFVLLKVLFPLLLHRDFLFPLLDYLVQIPHFLLLILRFLLRLHMELHFLGPNLCQLNYLQALLVLMDSNRPLDKVKFLQANLIHPRPLFLLMLVILLSSLHLGSANLDFKVTLHQLDSQE